VCLYIYIPNTEATLSLIKYILLKIIKLLLIISISHWKELLLYMYMLKLYTIKTVIKLVSTLILTMLARNIQPIFQTERYN
jgi:hypothetical protein